MVLCLIHQNLCKYTRLGPNWCHVKELNINLYKKSICKVEFYLKQLLGITRTKFDEDTMNAIKIKLQVRTIYICMFETQEAIYKVNIYNLTIKNMIVL